MGLDMYVYRAKKLSEVQVKRLSNKDYDYVARHCTCLTVPDKNISNKIYDEIRSLTSPVMLKNNDGEYELNHIVLLDEWAAWRNQYELSMRINDVFREYGDNKFSIENTGYYHINNDVMDRLRFSESFLNGFEDPDLRIAVSDNSYGETENEKFFYHEWY